MKTGIYAKIAIVIVSALLVGIASGCSNSAADGSALQDIPPYPNANEGEVMNQSIAGGIVGGSMRQFTTTDPFEEVVDFYTDALIEYDTEILSHDSDLGRQTAFSIPQKKGMITVAIQEFTEEESVNITFMAVGSL